MYNPKRYAPSNDSEKENRNKAAIKTAAEARDARIKRRNEKKNDLLKKIESSLEETYIPEFRTDTYQEKIYDEFARGKLLSGVSDIFFDETLRKFDGNIDKLIREQRKYPLDCGDHSYMRRAVRDWTDASLETVKSEVTDTHPEASATPLKKKATQEYSSLPMEMSVIETSSAKSPYVEPQPLKPSDLNIVYQTYLAGVDTFIIASESIENEQEVNLLRETQFKKPYSRGQFDTECLLFAIVFFNTLQKMPIDHPVIKVLTDAYKADNDDDDLMQMGLYDVNVPYNILKPLCYFILNGIVNNRGIIASLIGWIQEEDEEHEA